MNYSFKSICEGSSVGSKKRGREQGIGIQNWRTLDIDKFELNLKQALNYDETMIRDFISEQFWGSKFAYTSL